ncbi:hypothetical protein HDU82_005463, partial [Entophlyctis luteolus]
AQTRSDGEHRRTANAALSAAALTGTGIGQRLGVGAVRVKVSEFDDVGSAGGVDGFEPPVPGEDEADRNAREDRNRRRERENEWVKNFYLAYDALDNTFGLSFLKAAQRTNTAFRSDAFDNSITEIPKDDLLDFVEALQTLNLLSRFDDFNLRIFMLRTGSDKEARPQVIPSSTPTCTRDPDAPVALVTGCTKGGIGHALCVELARRGCRVFGTVRRMEALVDFRGIDVTPGSVELLPMDVTQIESVKRAVRAIIGRAGRIDILVNNAGIGVCGGIADTDLDEIKTVFETNVLGLISVTQESDNQFIVSGDLLGKFIEKKRKENGIGSNGYSGFSDIGWIS